MGRRNIRGETAGLSITTRDVEEGRAGHHPLLGRGGKNSEREMASLWLYSKWTTKSGFEPLSPGDSDIKLP